MNRASLWLFALSFLAFPPLLSAQDAAGSIVGNVICNDGNTPARGAKVILVPLEHLLSQTSSSEDQGAGSAEARSDFSGEYQLWSVRPGTYVVNAALDGYRDELKLALSALGNSRLEDRQRILAAFPRITMKPGVIVHLDLVLQRAAAISGRVSVDLGGVPERAAVTAIRVSDDGGNATTIAPIRRFGPFTQSGMIDDRGAYRIAGLPPGKYQISLRITEGYLRASRGKDGAVRLDPERPGTADLTIYAPESLSAGDARTIEVKDADEITDADITVPSRILHSIGGYVTDGGSPRAGMLVSLQLQGSAVQHPNGVTMPDGSYRFDLLPSGTYILRVLRTETPTDTVSSTSVQLVDSDILGANIELGSKLAPIP